MMKASNRASRININVAEYALEQMECNLKEAPMIRDQELSLIVEKFHLMDIVPEDRPVIRDQDEFLIVDKLRRYSVN